ncbi:uncharacterized protein LOC113678025 [Pocillopora damicornis]|uniref:uncharacterized protein LOC113678025 n=1 Tax=Pocillopora damicornis TaxID=46731 RepID=UPI000F54FA92|nr:uncharacterized protein LOC113678025 [Pocillopora damicornis]
MSLAMPTLLLMFVLDFAAIFFNGLLLLSCFRHEKKYRFFKKCWILLGLQVACQVVILVADAVEWWNGFRIQATESCNKSLFVMVFLAACSVLIFSDVALARFESALWGRDLKRDTSFDGTVYLLILKFCLGTCLPLTLYDLINLSYPRKKGYKSVSNYSSSETRSHLYSSAQSNTET